MEVRAVEVELPSPTVQPSRWLLQATAVSVQVVGLLSVEIVAGSQQRVMVGSAAEVVRLLQITARSFEGVMVGLAVEAALLNQVREHQPQALVVQGLSFSTGQKDSNYEIRMDRK
jgi:hypothetical protein